MQAIETDAPGALGRSLVERAHLHPEVPEARPNHHGEVDVRRDRDEDGHSRHEAAAFELPRRFELREDREHEEEREQLLDRLEAPQELAEDPACQVARGNLPEENRRREDDHERPADPESQRKADDLRGGLEQGAQV